MNIGTVNTAAMRIEHWNSQHWNSDHETIDTTRKKWNCGTVKQRNIDLHKPSQTSLKPPGRSTLAKAKYVPFPLWVFVVANQKLMVLGHGLSERHTTFVFFVSPCPPKRKSCGYFSFKWHQFFTFFLRHRRQLFNVTFNFPVYVKNTSENHSMEACIINILQCHDPFCCSMNHVNELEQTIIIEQLQWRLISTPY